jgi:hypothetical protein
MIEVLRDRPAEVIIGGAKGVDTAAFIACAKVKHSDNDLYGVRLTVVLPGYLPEAPQEFQEALMASRLLVNDGDRFRVTLLELGMDVSHPQSFHTRNSVMLGRAGWSATCAVLLSFTPIGEAHDSTIAMLEMARRERVRVVEQPVRTVPPSSAGASGVADDKDEPRAGEDGHTPGSR